MATDLKIRIAADATSAIKNLEDLTKAGVKFQKEFSTASKTIGNLKNGNGSKIWEEYRKNIELVTNSMIASGKGVEGYKKAISLLRREMETLNKFGHHKLAKQMASNINVLEEQMGSFKVQTKEATKTSDGFGKKLLSITKNIMGFQLVIATVRKGMTALVNLFKTSAEASAKAEQTFSKLRTVFDGINGIETRVNRLASTIGVANSTSANALSTVGDLLQAQGMTTAQSLEKATEWVSKFQDIIAFKDINMSLEEFAQNFMSGAAGNLRNFRTFGSIVKESSVNAKLAAEGLDKLTGSELELAKMVARAEIALEQQKNSVGATSREWETMESVNRRYNEAIKGWKENFGEAINEGLKPMKSAWADMLTEINKVNNATKEYLKLSALKPENYEQNSSWTKFWDNFIRGGKSKDVYPYAQMLSRNFTISGETDAEVQTNRAKIYTEQNFINAAIVGMETLGLSAQKVSMELQTFTNSVGMSADEIVKKAQETLKQQEENNKRRADVDSVASSYDAFQESLNLLAGLNRKSKIVAANKNGAYSNSNFISSLLVKDSIKALGNKSFSNNISVALGEDTEVESLKAQQNAYRSLYEQAHNYWIVNSETHQLTENQKKQLDEIALTYKSIGEKIKDYNAELERQKKIESKISSTSKSASDSRFNLKYFSKTDNQKAILKITKDWEDALNLAKTDDEITRVNEAFSSLVVTTKQLQEEEKKKAEQDRRTALAVQNMQSVYGMMGGYGGIASATSTFIKQSKTDEGIHGEDTVALVLSILQQFDGFNDAMSELADTFVYLNATLNPVWRIVKKIIEMLNVFLDAVGRPLFEAIKVTIQLVAGVVAMVVGYVTMAADVVINAFRGIYNFFVDVANGIAWVWNNTLGWIPGVGKIGYASRQEYEFTITDQLQKETNGLLSEIASWTWETAKNTESKTDLSAFNDMLNAGVINSEEWRALVSNRIGGSYASTSSLGNGVYSYNGASGSKMITGNTFAININGTGLNESQLKSAVINAIAEVTGENPTSMAKAGYSMAW